MRKSILHQLYALAFAAMVVSPSVTTFLHLLHEHHEESICQTDTELHIHAGQKHPHDCHYFFALHQIATQTAIYLKLNFPIFRQLIVGTIQLALSNNFVNYFLRGPPRLSI